MITAVGEALVDLVEDDDGRYRALPGGSPTNVAIALGRLWTPVSLLARISTDTFGRMLRAHLTGNGVAERDLVAAAEPTTLAVASLDSEGRAAYRFYVQGTADWQWTAGELPDPLPPDVVALHAGSLALALPPGAVVLEAMLRREHERGALTVALDPNIRPDVVGSRAAEVVRVERQVGLADVVKASEEDVAWLYPDERPEAVARRWRTLGPRVVVVTLGEAGAYALGPGGVAVRRRARPVRLADTVGAGDAFQAGLLHALFREGLLGPGGGRRLDHLTEPALVTLLDEALLVAALTCQRHGADPPTRAEVDAVLGPGPSTS